MKKIAIMGAGFAGLSCAFILEKHGLQPDIYEDRSEVEDRFVNGEIVLGMIDYPVFDCVAAFAERYGLNFEPVSPIRKLVIFSEKEHMTAQGDLLGYTLIRGRHPQAWGKQIARQITSPIRFNSRATLDQLAQTYDHVVVATGDPTTASSLNNFRKAFAVHINGGTMQGSFDPSMVAAWLDYRFVPGGYAYFIPYSEKEANLVLAYPHSPSNDLLSTEKLWEIFAQRLQKDLGITSQVHHHFKIENFSIGICRSSRVDNLLFTGNNFGALMPFLGFGNVASLLTGIYAAEDLLGISRYEEKTAWLIKKYNRQLALRKGIQTMSNPQLDSLVRLLRGWPINWIANSPWPIVDTAGGLLSPFVRHP